MERKTPYDLIQDLKKSKAKIEARIKNGESGNGRDSQDLHDVLRLLKGEIFRLEGGQKDWKRPKKLYPNSDHK